MVAKPDRQYINQVIEVNINQVIEVNTNRDELC